MSKTPKTLGQMVEEIIQAKYDQEAEWKRLAEAGEQLHNLTLWTIPDLVEALTRGRVHIAPGHDPALTAPTSAREALDLAWNLAHEVKEGQTIPTNTEYLLNHGLGYNLQVSISGRRIDSIDAASVRTLDPLPDPEPDWLDAPAVMACLEGWPSCADPQVFTRHDYDDAPSEWRYNGAESYHWWDLTEVTPLYPKEDTPHDAPRTYNARLNYDGPWGTRLGGDPA